MAASASASASSSSAGAARAATPPPSRNAPRGATRLFNPVALLVAGSPLFPLYGVIEHYGRRTGTRFRTPVVVRSTSDGFVVPLPWGDRTDWCRNVRAAGGCTIRWKGRDYSLVQPEVISDPSAARRLFGSLQGALMARFGITHCLRLRHARA